MDIHAFSRDILGVLKVNCEGNLNTFFHNFSLQELRRSLPVRQTDQWSVQNRSWWFGWIWSVLWSQNSRWRLDGVSEETGRSVDFVRAWDAYKRGFGNLNGDFWLGLDKIHRMTVGSRNKLRVDLEDLPGNTAFAEYSSFAVTSERAKYQMSLGTYTGELKRDWD